MATCDLSMVWPEWQIEKQIGKGSFGVVYQAIRQDTNLTSYAAIKVITIPQDSSEVEMIRGEGLDENATRTYFQNVVNDFVNEIQLMESFKGIQNIVSVEDYKVIPKEDEIGWDIYIRMELLKPFNSYIQENTLTEQDVIKLGYDICSALEICGQKNIIHRDIKPENIFVNEFGFFKLGDFGIARKMEHMTAGFSQKGTQNYMAPEVFAGSNYDARVDIYSLGIVLYRLMNANRMPFVVSEQQVLDPNARRMALERRLNGEKLPAPYNASPELANLILRACAYNPDQRFANPTEMKKALSDVLNGTYQAVDVVSEQDLDATMRINTIQDPDATMSVRHTPTKATMASSTDQGNTFGKKKSKLPKGLVILVFMIALVIGGFVAYPYFIPTGFEDVKDGFSKDEKKQIEAIIEEAERLVEDGKLEDGISKLEEGLATYPTSTDLKEELEIYKKQQYDEEKQMVLDEAKAFVEQDNFRSAVIVLKNALGENPSDEDYIATYEQYCNEYEKDVLSQVESLSEAGEFEKAIVELDLALLVLPENERLNDSKNDCVERKNTAIRTEAMNSADAKAQEGDYIGAYQIIHEALGKIGTDSVLSEAEKMYEDAYVKSITTQVDAYLTEQNISAAKELITTARTYLPNNYTLYQYKQNIEQYKTVLLDSMVKKLSSDWQWNKGEVIDVAGNYYTDLLNYSIMVDEYGSNNGYIEYALNERYATFSFEYMPYYGYGASSEIYIRIYVNDVLRYTSPLITAKTEKVAVSLDVSDAEYIKVCMDSVDSTSSKIVIMNAILTTYPNVVDTVNDDRVSLKLLDAFDAYKWSWESGFPQDATNGDYSDVKNYAIMGNVYSARAEYYLGGEYSSFSFDVAPGPKHSTSEYSVIKIYVDDKLVYTAKVLRKTKRVSVKDINVKGAEFIKIDVDGSYLIFSNLLLTKAE